MSAIVRHTGAQQVLRPSSFSELVQFATMAAKSAMVPDEYRGRPENIMLAVQMGSELGLAPMQAIQNISVINGRPSVWGDAMPALVRNSGLCKDIIERIEGEDKNMVAICIAHRKGAAPVERRFGMADAERAGLLRKSGPWQQYPRRMLQMRARSWALRDAFPDVLRGLIAVEEAQDILAEAPSFTGPTIEARTEPVRETVNETMTAHMLGDAIPALDLPAPARRTAREEIRDRLAACFSREDVAAVEGLPLTQKVLTAAPDEIKAEVRRMLDDAFARFEAAVPAMET